MLATGEAKTGVVTILISSWLPLRAWMRNINLLGLCDVEEIT
jgi:hypothetical protein